jgi:uncharacterized membrane protein YecN with MAPEG domain
MQKIPFVTPQVKVVVDLGETRVHHGDVPPSMPRLSHNPMTPTRYSMFAVEQCPKALAWMASLALAAGKTNDARAWVVELIGMVVLVKHARLAQDPSDRAPQDTASMS